MPLRHALTSCVITLVVALVSACSAEEPSEQADISSLHALVQELSGLVTVSESYCMRNYPAVAAERQRLADSPLIPAFQRLVSAYSIPPPPLNPNAVNHQPDEATCLEAIGAFFQMLKRNQALFERSTRRLDQRDARVD